MHVGDRTTDYAFWGSSIGGFAFWAQEGTTNVTETRLDDHTWMVTTDEPYALGAGDVAHHDVTVKKTTARTLYHLPFQATVTCPTCVAPL